MVSAWRWSASPIRPPIKTPLGRVEAGFCARYAARRKFSTRANTRLAEQSRNRNHHSSNPSGQAKKQQNVTQEHRHVTPPWPSQACHASLALPVLGPAYHSKKLVSSAPLSGGTK